MSGPSTTVDFSDIRVNHSETVVYKSEKTKTHVPAFAQAKLKPAAGGKTRTFKGGTTVTSTSSGPRIISKGPSITPAAQASGPKITITAAAGTTAPSRIVQPVGTVSSAPAAYVPEKRLYQPRKSDASYLNSEKEPEPVAVVAPTPAPEPVVAAPAPPAPVIEVAPPPVAALQPVVAAPAPVPPVAIPTPVAPAPVASTSSAAAEATTTTLTGPAGGATTARTATTTVTTTTTTVEDQSSCCVVL